MRYNQLGTSDLKVSDICLGTMTWGEQNSEADAHQQLDYAISRGVNFIDTAEMYPVPPRAETQGRTEIMVGTWLAKQSRDKVIVATKVAGAGRNIAYMRGGPVAVDRKNVQQAIDGSLQRLQTDYIDLYQIHWPDRYVPMFGKIMYDPAEERASSVPIEEQLGVFADFIKAGKIRHLGVSNETPWGLCEWSRIAKERSLPKIVSIQNAYSLINRTFEAGLSEVSRRENISLVAYSALGFGHLTAKYLNGAKPEGARLTRFPAFGQRYEKINVPAAVAAYADLAGSIRLSPSTLAIAFARSKWFVSSTIIGATTLQQLAQNIDAGEIALDASTLDAIDEVHSRFPNPAI